jgi:hypothetical protein
MIDPVTIGLVIGGAKALKSAFETAKEAMDEFRACADAGMGAAESMGSLVKFFTAQGEVKKTLVESKLPPKPTADGTPVETKSDTAVALEAMQYELQLREDEEEIKTYLIYKCRQSGLYDELCRRRDEIANARAEKEEEIRRAETERILEIKRVAMAKRRARAKKIAIIEETIAVIVGSAVACLIVYGIYWMFRYGGSI